MATYVQIANLCGALVGSETRITDPNDDRMLARCIRDVWDIERRSAIRDGEWNFAVERAALPALAAAVPYPYAYAYQKPAQCLRLLEVLNDEAAEDYALEGQTILANAAPPLYVRYLLDVTNEGLWDDGFAEAFAARLAWAIGERIAGSAYNREQGWQYYLARIAAGKSTDARENPPLEQAESSWITARWGVVDPGPL